MEAETSENLEKNLKRRAERFVSKMSDFILLPRGTGMQRLMTWQQLNRQQLGAYAEYFVKMFLTMNGFQVYSTEVDDRGIDFIARYEKGPFIEIQVKSLRTAQYVFMEKSKFELNKTLYLALVLFKHGEYPDIYFIPSTRWENTDEVFVGRDYVGKKSKPEWGINVSMKNIPAFSQFKAETSIDELKKI